MSVALSPLPTFHIETNLNSRDQIRKKWEGDFNSNVKLVGSKISDNILKKIPTFLGSNLENGYKPLPSFSNPLSFDIPFSLVNVDHCDQLIHLAPDIVEIEPFKSWLNKESGISQQSEADRSYFESFMEKITKIVKHTLQNNLTDWVKLPENNGLKCKVETTALNSNNAVSIKFWLDSSLLSKLK